MTEILKSTTPYQIREELQTLVLNDLLGPAGGPEEEVNELRVSERYLVGMLAPKRQPITADAYEELAISGEEANEDGQTDTSAPPAESLLPSSFGLTFAVDGQTKALKITARWGRYSRVDSEVLTNPKTGNPQKVWKRTPVENTSEPLKLRPGTIRPWIVSPDQPNVFVQGIVRQYEGDWVVTLFLVNNQQAQTRLGDEAWLFQPELIVEAADGAAAFVKRTAHHNPQRMDALSYAEERALSMRYRHVVAFAVGHGVAVHAETDPQNPQRAFRISTQTAPIYEVAQQTAPKAAEIPELAGLVLDMKELAHSAPKELAPKLVALLTAYAAWIAEEKRKAESEPDLFEFKPEVNTAIQNCERTLKRIKAGIELLTQSSIAAEAFCLANEAMWLQRVRTLYSEKIRREEACQLAEIDIPQNRTWYPFQLAFFLINLPGLTDLHHPDRTEPADAVADLLWFPTGGGKTEAYLGLAAYTMFLRRLQGSVEGRDGMNGVAVIMRYTLRLLTLQQFQRAAALLCACEVIRRQRESKGDRRLGNVPFRIGLWVGMKTTPNSTEQSDESIKRGHGQYSAASHAGGIGSPAQLKNCPWCGQLILSGRDIHVEKYSQGRGRTIIYCSDKLGRCPFSRRQSPGEGIPVILVDEEIYRNLPAMLIATVDKFAQMPWKGEVQMLFGQVNGYCPRHGFQSPEIEDSHFHPKRGHFPAVKAIPHPPLRPPDLIIQDELHLIVGPLGTMVGLYETAIDELASWEVGGQRVRPKVVASTATIRRASDQVQKLFLRRVNIFPPQGTDARDNFFSRERQPNENFPGRRYLGICAPGKRIKTALIRVYVASMAASQKLYEKYGKLADPYMTLVGYFNSMRELGGTRRIVDDSVRSLLREMEKRGLANRKKPNVKELTSRLSATDIPHLLDLLEVPFNPEDDKLRKQATRDKQQVYQPFPIDVLLATNMVSVGVDVKRLGLMVVQGQPKTTAEYIQATSRVGRSRPGLAFIIYNWARPRDLSHFEQFEHYHATFHQFVEALTVTPFASRALERGLSGLFVALVRLAAEEFNENKSAAQFDANHPIVQDAMTRILNRAEMIEGDSRIKEVIKLMLTQRVETWLQQAKIPTGGNLLGYKDEKDGITRGLLRTAGLGPWEQFTCLTSLREVETTVGLILDDGGLDDVFMNYDESVLNQQEEANESAQD